MNLGPWQPHPKYPHNEARCAPDGTPVLVLLPEGFSTSCWVWLLGSMHGSDHDRETARRQADACARQQGHCILCDQCLHPDHDGICECGSQAG